VWVTTVNIAITTSGFDMDAPVDVRFGRAKGFLIVETETGNARYLENREGVNAGQGAGIQAARLMAADGVQVVLTGHCGPNAFRALRAAGIRVYTGLTGGSVREAVERFKAGALQEGTAADVQGHW
jgi:predicted Fe-Mo cluster-binding NifX family protein